MGLTRAMASGVAGAVALNLLHESMRRAVTEAPRVDRLAMNLLEDRMRQMDWEPPSERGLYRVALGSDLVSNSAYYSLVGLGEPGGAWWRGALLGLGAGVTTVAFPWMAGGYGREEVARTPLRAAMTIGYYTFGGLVAGSVATFWGTMTARRQRREAAESVQRPGAQWHPDAPGQTGPTDRPGAQWHPDAPETGEGRGEAGQGPVAAAG